MLRLLKNLFNAQPEVDNDLFFDEISHSKDELNKKQNHDIPTEALAKVIRSKKNVITHATLVECVAMFSVDKEGGRCFKFEVNIFKGDSYFISKKVIMSYYDRPFDKFPREKEIKLADKEAAYLFEVIKQRHDTSEQKKQQNTRQEMQNILESALNTSKE